MEREWMEQTEGKGWGHGWPTWPLGAYREKTLLQVEITPC